MLRRLNNHKAQANVGEYVLIFFLIIGMITAMTIYVRRALQARIFDATRLIKNADCFGPGCVPGTKHLYAANMLGNIVLQYEPYYVLSYADREGDFQQKTTLTDGSFGGVFSKTVNEVSYFNTISETLSPAFENPSTPVTYATKQSLVNGNLSK